MKKLDISSVHPKTLSKYKKLIPYKYRHLLKEKSFILGLEIDSEPFGICICQLDLFLKTCVICHLNAPENSIEIILKTLEEHLKKQQFLSIVFTYEDNPYLESLLDRKIGWSPSSPWASRYSFDCKNFHPAWFEKKYHLPKKYKITPWINIFEKQDEVQHIKFHLQQYCVPLYLSPFLLEKYIQTMNSLALIYEDRVVGWILTHTYPDKVNTVVYTNLYVYPNQRFTGLAIFLLIESIKLQQNSSIRWSSFEVLHHSTSRSWKKFCDSRLRPYSIDTREFVRRHKEI
ncbi:MAG: hypothetical protein VX777_08030 [Chlamydiota bacterium]|nr:hypothetical protein [Chlamydiota bacterium]